jgi:hypothetical protein
MTTPRRVLLCVAALLSAAGLRADDGPEPAAPPKPIEYVEGRGVVFRTPDGLFEASLGFNLQFRFTHFNLDAAAGGSPPTAGTARPATSFSPASWMSPSATRTSTATETPAATASRR